MLHTKEVTEIGVRECVLNAFRHQSMLHRSEANSARRMELLCSTPFDIRVCCIPTRLVWTRALGKCSTPFDIRVCCIFWAGRLCPPPTCAQRLSTSEYVA